MTHAFYRRLVDETSVEQAGFMNIDVIRHAVANGVDRALYLEYLASAYHHVKHTCPLLGLALSRCGDDDQPYRAGLLAYLDEEKGHEEWILNDIGALGGDAEAVRRGLAPFPARMMTSYAYYAIDRISPYAQLGMVHVLEGMSVALARAVAGAIQAEWGLGAEAEGFSYLTSHGQLDEEHVALFAALLDQIDTPERRAVVIQAAKDFYQLFGDMFRALAGSTEQRHEI